MIRSHLYASCVTNYDTHERAEEVFAGLSCAAALELQRDGSAVIVLLHETPVQDRQAEYVGTQPRLNKAAQALGAAREQSSKLTT